MVLKTHSCLSIATDIYIYIYIYICMQLYCIMYFEELNYRLTVKNAKKNFLNAT